MQGSQPFKIGGALEQVLVSAAEEGSILFVHRSRKGDAYVIGLSSSVDEIQAALPPAVLWDSSVPRCLLDGEAPGRKHEKGVLVWLFAHNKLFSLRWMGNNPKYYCSGKPCQHVKAFAKNIHSSRKRMHPPLAFSHECNSLSPEEKDLVGLLDDEKYKDIAEEVAFDTGDKQINMFVFLSTDLLTASKTDFLRVSSNELETRIVPGALGSYFLEVIKCRKDELAVEAEKARKERASAAKRQSRFRAAEGAGGPCSPSTTLHSSVHVMASAGGAGEVSGDSMATELYAPSRRPARAAKEAAKTCLKYITKPMHMPPPVTPTKVRGLCLRRPAPPARRRGHKPRALHHRNDASAQAPNARAKRKHAQQEAGRGCKAARGSAKTNAACQTRPAWGIDLEALELLAVQLRSRASSAPARSRLLVSLLLGLAGGLDADRQCLTRRSSLAGHWVKVAYMDVYDDGETMWKKWLGLVLEHKPQTSCCSVFFCGVTFKGNDGTEPVLEPERRSIEEVDHQAHDRDSPFASSFEVMGEDFVRKLLGGD